MFLYFIYLYLFMDKDEFFEFIVKLNCSKFEGK